MMADDAGPSVASTAQDYPATTGLSAASSVAPDPLSGGLLMPPTPNIEQYRKDEDKALTQMIGAEGHYAREQASKDREYESAMKAKFAQESSSLDDVKPWNPQTMAPPRTSLWEQIGSPGFVFAMLASSFSAMPMNAAMNSGAAAMNAINQGDMEAYDRAFNEWKTNTDLAIHRHAMEREEFQDIGTLWDKDKAAARSRLESYLTQINDKRKLSLLRAGMDKETWDAIEAQNKAMEQIIKLQQPMMEQHALISAVNADPNYKKDPIGTIAKYEKQLSEAKYAGRYGSSAAGHIQGEIDRRRDQWNAANPDATDKERDAAYDDIARDVVRSMNPIGEQRANTADYAAKAKVTHDQTMADLASKKIDLQQARDQEDALHKQNQDAIAKLKEGREEAAEQERVRHDMATEEIAKNKSTQLTANKSAELRIASDRYTTGLETIDKLTALIKKHIGAVGAAGYATRSAESLSNVIAGSNETDRREIQSLLHELQMLTPRLITESTSRPLAGEHEHVSEVVRGLNEGDTKPNVLRNLEDLRSQLVRMKANIDSIVAGKPAETTEEKPATETGGDTPEWMRGRPTGD